MPCVTEHIGQTIKRLFTEHSLFYRNASEQSLLYNAPQTTAEQISVINLRANQPIGLDLLITNYKG